MAMIDPNITALPGSKKALGLLFSTGAADALLIVGQAVGLAVALAGLWDTAGSAEGINLSAQVPWIALFLACFVARQLVKYGRDYFMSRYARTQAASLREQLMHHLAASGPSTVQAHGLGATTTMVVEGIDQVRTYVGLILPKVADLMVIPTVLSVALFALDWVSGIIAVVMLPCIMYYMRLLGANAKAAAAKQHGEFERMGNHFVDALRGVATLKAFGRSKDYADEVYTASERFRKATMKTLKAAFLSSLVLDLFRTFALAAVAIMLGFRLMSGDIALMPALAVLIIVPEYFAAVRRYANDFHASLDGKNQLQAICDLLAEPLPRIEEVPVRPWDDTSKLTLAHLDFSYGEAQVLHDVNLEFSGCTKVGIVGVSGSGKSTLANLLAGFAEPTGGSLSLDGTSVDTLRIPAWQRQVTYIPQNPHLFSTTLRDNVAFYCPSVTDQQIENALATVGLEPTSAELPEGLDTRIGEGGRQLSGGQAQRIALARALLDDSRRVLIFDEPTAHLDIETELALKERMLPLMEGRLVLFATHRLHWIHDMDLIVVLEGGTVAEVGTPDELLSRDGALTHLANRLRGGEHHGA